MGTCPSAYYWLIINVWFVRKTDSESWEADVGGEHWRSPRDLAGLFDTAPAVLFAYTYTRIRLRLFTEILARLDYTFLEDNYSVVIFEKMPLSVTCVNF